MRANARMVGHLMTGARPNTATAETQIVLRLRFSKIEPFLGPGKIELMEHIEREGSISAACRAYAHFISSGVDHRTRDERDVSRTVSTDELGGTTGGGAQVTPLGHEVVKRFRAIESCLWRFAAEDIAALEAEIGHAQDHAGARS